MTTTALRITDHSGRPVPTEVDLPPCGPGEVLVELAYAGVNPVDQYIAKGMVSPDAPLPRTLGGEASGSIRNTPVLVAGAALGALRDGTWAQRAVVPREAVLRLPANVDPQQAAGAGVAGLTAWSTVVDLAGVTAADRVLVLGSAGGVGLTVVSLAASLGAEVWGQVRSADREPDLLAAGAAGVVAAAADRLTEAAAGFQPTVVIDALGGEFVAPALAVLEPHGRYVVFGTSAGSDVHVNWQAVYRSNLQVLGYGGMMVATPERRRRLHQVVQAIGDGRMTIPVGRILALADGRTVFDRQQDGPVGKTLLDLR